MKNYSITDLLAYATHTRDSVASEMKPDYKDNLDDFITVNQILDIVKEHSLGVDDDNCFIINEEIHNDIFDSIEIRIFNVGLAKLAASGAIECAWDDKENEMVFWVPSSGVHDDNSKNNGIKT